MIMDDRLYELFDGIDPSKSSDELLEAVLRKAECTMEKKRRSKKMVVIPAAAAALTIGAVSVGAAYEWDIAQAFDIFFSGRGSTQQSGSGFDFAEAGKELFVELQAEHCDITVNGILAGESKLYMLYDVEFEEGFDCATGTDAEWSNWLFDAELSVNGGEPFKGGCKIGSINGSRYTLCADWELNDDTFDIGDELTVSFDGMFRYHNDEFNEQQHEELNDIGFDTVLDVEVITEGKRIDADRSITLCGQDALLSTVYVTPFDISWEIVSDVDADRFMNGVDYSDISYTTKDGTTVSADGSVITSCYTAIGGGVITCNAEWSYPVNLSDIASVTIFGTTVELE